AGRVIDRRPIPSEDRIDPPEEVKAYCLALTTAHATSSEAFANSARRDLTYAHLFEEPEKYRGEVVHYQGRLKRVRQFDAPEFIRDYLPVIYECWLFDLKVYGANPLGVLVTELPRGVPVKEQLDIPVTVDGYFFKRWRYQAGDGWRDAPLLIGRTLRI